MDFIKGIITDIKGGYHFIIKFFILGFINLFSMRLLMLITDIIGLTNHKGYATALSDQALLGGGTIVLPGLLDKYNVPATHNFVGGIAILGGAIIGFVLLALINKKKKDKLVIPKDV